MTNLILNFPEGYSPNKSQTTILKKIDKAFSDGKKYVIVNAPTGCLAGDTQIILNNSGNSKRYSIKDIYRHFHGRSHHTILHGICQCGCGGQTINKKAQFIKGHFGRNRKWKRSPKIRSLMGDILGNQYIENVIFSGVKEVYEIKLENDMNLKGTACHPILTTVGYVRIDELTTDHIVVTDPVYNPPKKKSKQIKVYDNHVSGLTYHPFGRLVKTKKYYNGFTYRVPAHILTMEAKLNNLDISELKKRCKNNNIEGLNFIDPRIYHVHHIDHDHYNNNPSNLQLMTKRDHCEYHGLNGNVHNFEYFTPTESRFSSRKYIGLEETFDIQCPDPHHNFVANGIIVHNSGKSFLAPTLANSTKDIPQAFKDAVDDYTLFGEDGASLVPEESFGCYALTITKALQDQYKNTFDYTGILKGQSNYQCKVDEEMTVDVAPCIYVKGMKNDCWKANKCPYYNQRNKMLKSKFTALNYSMFFSLPEHLKKREILVCDEGSELEEQLVSQFTCEVDIPFLMKTNTSVSSFPVEEKPAKVVNWLSELLRNVSTNVESYKEYFKEGKNDPMEFNKKKGEYSKLLNLQSSLDILIGTYYDSEYLIERIDKKIRFIPLKVDKLSSFLFDHADRVVIMSATIIDPYNFCKNLGITDYEYIEVDSAFDAEKAPIYILASQKLNFKNMDQMLPKIAKQVSELLEEHKDEKGIIHTHTQFITDYIRNNVKSSRLLCREGGVRNEELLDIHERSKEPTVLVSPSMTYGVDLKGDLGKFQILLKAPWLPTKDIRVERLMKIDKDWYSNAMLKTLIQACGRGVRSLDDECVTYILDGSIFDAVHRNKKKLPKFFIDRFQ